MTKEIPKRIISIDRYRGFIVFCMCFFITAAEFPCLGLISRVANNSATTRLMLMKGFSLADLIDPIFIFLISLSYQSSFDRRYKINKRSTYIHFISRYLTFIGLGSIMVSGEYFLVKNGKDPLTIMTILMFIAVISLLINFLIKKISKIPEKYKNKLSKIPRISLLLLGVIGIILGIRDAIILYGNIPNYDLYRHWSILHEIGVTGLLALPFMRFNLKEKIASWFIIVALLSGYQLLPGIVSKFDVIVLGGLMGTIGWLIILLGGMIIMELFKKTKKYYIFISYGILIILSIILFKIVPLNTSAVTTNYTILSLLIASLVFGILNIFNNKELKYEYFVWWGKNPLPIFLIYLIIRVIEKMWSPGPDTSLLVASLYTFGSIFFLSFIAYYFNKKKVIIKL